MLSATLNNARGPLFAPSWLIGIGLVVTDIDSNSGPAESCRHRNVDIEIFYK